MDLSGRKRRENGEDCIVRSFITFVPHQLLLGCWIGEKSSRMEF